MSLSLTVIKLGGSVITDKSTYKMFRSETTRALAAELAVLAKNGHRFFIVHGAGSYGHIKAKEYRLNDGCDDSVPAQREGLVTVARDVRELDLLILDILDASGLLPISLPPGALVRNTDRHLTAIDLIPFKNYYGLGFTPVTFGDVVLDTACGFSICSGDVLVYELARAFPVTHVIFVTDVDGLYDPRSPPGKRQVLPQLDEQLLRRFQGKDGTAQSALQTTADVTGGIWQKVRIGLEISKMGIPVAILNGNYPERITGWLRGEAVVHTSIGIDLSIGNGNGNGNGIGSG